MSDQTNLAKMQKLRSMYGDNQVAYTAICMCILIEIGADEDRDWYTQSEGYLAKAIKKATHDNR